MKKRLIILLTIVFAAITADGCTSAIVSGSHTKSGRPLLWKHRDTSNANSRIAYRTAEHPGELSYVGLFNANDSRSRQAWMGMNEAGFAIMNTASYNILPKGQKSRDHEGLVMAAALRQCRTVDDFARFLDSLPRPIGVETNFGVIDAMGNGAYFETGNDSFVRYDLKDAPEGFMVRTNNSHSGQNGKGSGLIREANAVHLIAPLANQREVTPEFLTEVVSRSFYRDDDGLDHLCNDTTTIIRDRDFIPRYTSVATCVVEGMVPSNQLPDSATVARQYIMWTGLGYPPAAEIRPVWCRPDGVESQLQGQGPDNHAPLADRAQAARRDVFSVPMDGKKRFLDIEKLSNDSGSGYMQRIIPVNLDTYRRYKDR